MAAETIGIALILGVPALVGLVVLAWMIYLNKTQVTTALEIPLLSYVHKCAMHHHMTQVSQSLTWPLSSRCALDSEASQSSFVWTQQRGTK